MHVNKTTKEEHISALILGENRTKQQKNKMENKYATVNNHKEKNLMHRDQVLTLKRAVKIHRLTV